MGTRERREPPNGAHPRCRRCAVSRRLPRPGSGGHACGFGGWFRIRMMVVVARPVSFWLRATLKPAAAASRTALSRLTALQLRRLSSAALSGSRAPHTLHCSQKSRICDTPCQPSPQALLTEDGPRRPWREPPGQAGVYRHPINALPTRKIPGPGTTGCGTGTENQRGPRSPTAQGAAPASPHLSGRGPHV
jgi:hypothetical protein